MLLVREWEVLWVKVTGFEAVGVVGDGVEWRFNEGNIL